MSKRDQTSYDESFLAGTNATFIEQLYAQYLKNPSSVSQEWEDYFRSMNNGSDQHQQEDIPWARSDWPPVESGELVSALDGQWNISEVENKIKSKANATGQKINADQVRAAALDSIRAIMLIRAYRLRGHLIANLDPLGLVSHEAHPELNPKHYGFEQKDMDRPIFIDDVLGLEEATMNEIIDLLRRTYCGAFALQFMHISDPEQVSWLKERIEGYGKEIKFTQEGRKAILNKLVETEGFEKFLHVKYTGTKRFGIDGGEALIPAMEQIIKRGGALGVKEVVIGMPHRGRLNILSNVMNKPYRAIFNEFQGGSFKPDSVGGSGDVKYHLGASSDREFDDNVVHVSLTANPSHLEAVNPVVIGKVRAKQNQLDNNLTRDKVIPILLHGDAAFAGQGVVAECFGLSGLKGYRTGGTIHIVVNNQIGFTTSPHNSRSSPYPTDISLMVEAPIFHVNGDDPEAVVHAAKVATEFRQKFNKDVVIDIFCYRRFGHNEGDEPMFTQPAMYKLIKQHPSTLDIYANHLIKQNIVSKEEVEQLRVDFQEYLRKEFDTSNTYKPNKADWLDGKWSGFETSGEEYERGNTSVDHEKLKTIGEALYTLPKTLKPHRTITRLMDSKKEMFETGQGFDWATAEAMAFGSLVQEGYPVRLSGQDCMRGTFSQRHSGIIDQETEERYFPLNNIKNVEPKFEVVDSMLSEYAVLGFEYGYTLAEPQALVLWEAQFGDFVNGAQIMIDQFICCGELKWLRMSGLVMLLPHGYEGQGPEHSSARIERFLQLSAEDNWIVANCTTPANYFHILRRQLHRNYRKPLILFTPKSLLRHKRAVSKFEDMTQGSSFHRVLWDDADGDSTDIQLKSDNQIKRVVICSGKVYYDLFEERNARGLDNVYLLRLEQYYPFPHKSLVRELERFAGADIVWCQEEPKNQGAWSFVEPYIEQVLQEVKTKSKRASYVGRRMSASPATGLASNHKKQQEQLVDEALTIVKDKK